jgi:hypothetical protein
MEGLKKDGVSEKQSGGKEMVPREKGEKEKSEMGGNEGISARESGEVEGFLGCRRQQGLDRWLRVEGRFREMAYPVAISIGGVARIPLL